MNSYQVRLVLEALCQVHSIEALEERTAARRTLCRNFLLSKADADVLLEGALLLQNVRARRSEKVVIKTHLH